MPTSLSRQAAAGAARRSVLAASAVAAVLLLWGTGRADEATLSPLEDSPPSEVAAELSALVGKTAARVTDARGRPMLDVWLRREAPVPDAESVRAATGVSFSKDIDEGAFLGIVRLHKKCYDFRDNAIPAGTYTMRYAVQPMDGDHLGVSETRDFVLLCPLEKDRTPAPLRSRQIAELSAEVSGSKHPVSLYLFSTRERKRPASLPAVLQVEDRGWTAIDFEIGRQGEKDGDKPKTNRFGLVIVGKTDAV